MRRAYMKACIRDINIRCILDMRTHMSDAIVCLLCMWKMSMRLVADLSELCKKLSNYNVDLIKHVMRYLDQSLFLVPAILTELASFLLIEMIIGCFPQLLGTKSCGFCFLEGGRSCNGRNMR